MPRLRVLRIERERILPSFHHDLHALPAHPDDGGGAGWEVVDDAGSFALISSRVDVTAIDGIDVDAVGGRCVLEVSDGLDIQGNNVLEVLPWLLSLVSIN